MCNIIWILKEFNKNRLTPFFLSFLFVPFPTQIFHLMRKHVFVKSKAMCFYSLDFWDLCSILNWQEKTDKSVICTISELMTSIHMNQWYKYLQRIYFHTFNFNLVPISLVNKYVHGKPQSDLEAFLLYLAHN